MIYEVRLKTGITKYQIVYTTNNEQTAIELKDKLNRINKNNNGKFYVENIGEDVIENNNG